MEPAGDLAGFERNVMCLHIYNLFFEYFESEGVRRL